MITSRKKQPSLLAGHGLVTGGKRSSTRVARRSVRRSGRDDKPSSRFRRMA